LKGVRKVKRHESLVPLSREHHHGLALCLGIHREIGNHIEDRAWLKKNAEKAADFFATDLRAHFKAEEEIVFPAMIAMKEAVATIAQLIDEHRHLNELALQLRTTPPGETAASLLQEFADLLEAHIRCEERVLFPIYERNIASSAAERVGLGVREIIGEGTTAQACRVAVRLGGDAVALQGSRGKME
jgi:iron-sulfur cluster repair protein YtfE (RIC family)